MFLTSDDVTRLRERIRQNYRSEFQSYVNELDQHFGESPATKENNMLFNDAMNYAFLYLIDPSQMSGFQFAHTQTDYGRKALEHAMVAKDKKRGDRHSSASIQSDSGGYHNLSIGVVYDWVYPLLSLSQKRALADGLIRLYDDRDKDTYPGHHQKLSNKVTGYMHHGCVGALAIWGDKLGPRYETKAQEMLNYFKSVFLDRTLATADRVFEGPGWSEGASYYMLSLTNISMLAGAASSAMGVNLFSTTEFLRKNSLYIYYNILPLSLGGNYYMSRHDTNSLQPVIGSRFSRLFTISASVLSKDDADMSGFSKWMLTDGGFGLPVEKYEYFDPRIDYLFFKFIWSAEDVVSRSPADIGLPLMYKLGLGEIVMQSSYDKESTTHIIFWAPKFYYSPHAHADISSFTIFKHGSLALDAGNSKSGKDLPRGSSSGKVVFHNVLGLYDPSEDDDGFNYMEFDINGDSGADLWSDPAFQEGGANYVGKVRGQQSDAGADYVDYDYSHAYGTDKATFARRRLVYLRGPENSEYLVVCDNVTSSLQKRWLLHTAYEPTIRNNVITVTNNFDRAHGRMFVTSVLPKEREILKVGGDGMWFPDANWKEISSRGPYKDWGAYWVGSYRIEIRSNDGHYLTVMQIGDSRTLVSPMPVAAIDATDFSGVLVHDRLVLFNDSSTPRSEVAYTIAATGTVRHLIDGLVPKTDFEIKRDGARVASSATTENGVLQFQDDPGGEAKYTVTTAAGSAESE